MSKINQTEYQTVILAAFLHDIGKLLGRGQFKMLDKGQHPQFSSTFINAHHDFFSSVADADLLRELVQKHHENSRAFPDEFLVQSIKDERVRTLAKLVSHADNLSSSERNEKADKYQDYKKTTLKSVLQRLDNPTDSNINLSFHAYPLPSIPATTLKNIASILSSEFTEFGATELNALITTFGKTFEQFAKRSTDINYANLCYFLNNLIYTHTWCIPSNTQENIPDISLYDHLKITAAIATCLYRYHAETDSISENKIATVTEDRYLIATGDISGIQNYIFDITGSVTGGVARMLRARSLYIQLCTEVVIHQILNEINLPPWNIIMNSGGNFYLLLPNLPDIVATLEQMQTKIDSWFIHNLNGELSLNLAWYPFNDEKFKPGSDDTTSGFGAVLNRVKTRLESAKQNHFRSILQSSNTWNEPDFIIPVDYQGKKNCESCHKHPAELIAENKNICNYCQLNLELGKKLPEANYIHFYDNENDGLIPVLGYSVSVDSKPVANNKPYLACAINKMEIEITPYPMTSKYLANYIAHNEQGIVTFEGIAKKSQGQQLLGCLKADVDRLGELMIFGLRREKSEKDSKPDKIPLDTVSRQTTTSRLLDTFFTGYMQNLVSTTFPDCYTIFSGGDDLIYIGPWNKILELAERLNADFHTFSGNPNITISAGIAITKHGYPVAKTIELADQGLKNAKKTTKKMREEKEDYKTSHISLLNSTLSWEQWSAVKQQWEYLKPLMEASFIQSSFIYNMLRFAEMWQHYQGGDVKGLKYHPLLAYQIRRNLDEHRTPEIFKWASRLIKWPLEDKEQKLMDNLGLIMQLCLLSRRGGKNDL